jgi:hypothetical protein
LDKDPLSPFVVIRVGRVDCTTPIVGEPKLLELLSETGNVLLGGFCRVSACLDGILLGWQAEGIPPHGM